MAKHKINAGEINMWIKLEVNLLSHVETGEKKFCNRTADCSPASPAFPIASQAGECSRTHLDFRSNCSTAFYSSNPICCLLISGPMFIPSAMGANGLRYNQIYARQGSPGAILEWFRNLFMVGKVEAATNAKHILCCPLCMH